MDQEPGTIRLKDLENWLENPVTHIFHELVAEHCRAKEEWMFQIIRDSKNWKDVDQDEMQITKGEVRAFSVLEDLRQFMIERLDEKSQKELYEPKEKEND